MTALWLRIDSDPVRQIVSSTDALPHVDPSQSTHALLLAVGTLRSGTSETSSVTVTLANDAGQSSRLFGRRPPSGVVATLYRGAVPLFVGTIADVGLDADATIEIHA